MRLDRQQLDAIVQAVCDRLDGEWLLIGGALVALELDHRRATEDVDLIGLGGTQQERFALLQLAADLGLPVETVNSAADFFVHRIEGWRSRITLLRKGARGAVFRPDATLFVELKLRRLTEQDLADCLAMMAKEPVEDAVIRADLVALPQVDDERLRARRLKLLAALSGRNA